MGGVNFTRNRAWWHVAVWDEYSQRHQYLMILPTFALMIPYYWHGAFLNRDIEQNFAAKMYALDYEQRRNRITHNLIMEHFETHVEKAQDILEEVETNGFEHTFKNEIERGLFSDFPKEMEGAQDIENWSKDKHAEVNDYYSISSYVNHLLNTSDLPLKSREELVNKYPFRRHPLKPWKFMGDYPLTSSNQHVEHYVYVPDLPQQLNNGSVKVAGAEEAEDDE